MLDRAAWDLTVGDIERWTGRSLPVPSERPIFSAVADTLWSERQRESESRRIVIAENTPVTVLWRRQSTEGVALAISPNVLRGWIAHAIPSGANHRLTLLSGSGELLAGSAPRAGSAIGDENVTKS